MTNTPIISSARLDLIPLTPAFLQASLQGDSTTAESLLGLSLPSEWFQEQPLIRLRLTQLQQNPALKPWLLRVITLRHQSLMVGHIGFHTQPGADYLRDLAPGGIELVVYLQPADKWNEPARRKRPPKTLDNWAFGRLMECPALSSLGIASVK